MKTVIPTLLLWSSVAFAPHAQAVDFLLAAGVACQPATASDAAKLDYVDGSATNIHAAPGTSAQTASVVCQLPTIPPRFKPVNAGIYFVDPDRRWTKCYFHNLWPGTAAPSAMTRDVPGRPGIGVASLAVDASLFVPHAVRCAVRPGQSLYGVQVDIAPLP